MQRCAPCHKKEADALDEYDAELAVRRTLWRNEKLLPPLGEMMPIRNTYEKLMQLLMVYTGIFVPLWAFFQIPYHPAQLFVDYLIDVCFWVDIMLTWRTSYYDAASHELAVDKKLIQGAYVKKRLHLDVLGNLPVELIALAAGYGIDNPIFAAWRLNRMLRFFRIMKLHPPVLVELNSSGPRRLVNFFPLIMHWVACLQFYIGISGPITAEGELTINNIDALGGTSWLMRPNYGTVRLGSESTVQAYVSSLYWAAATLMKTAWVAPSTVVEKIYACIIVLMGAIMFAVFLGQVFKLIALLDEGSAQRREKMAMFRLFCRHNKLSPSMSRKVINYAMAEWNVTRGVSTAETLKLLSPALSGQVLQAMRKDILEACPLTSRTSLACAKKLLTRASAQVCLKNEYVIGVDEPARELFILIKGSLKITNPSKKLKGGKGWGSGPEPSGRMSSKKNLLQFRMLEKMGGITGLWNAYENGLRYTFEVQATDFTTMLNINKAALLETMNMFDEDRPKIADILEKEYDLVQQALRMGDRGKSMRSMRSSGSDEPATPVEKDEDEDETAVKRKATLTEVTATLESVNAGLNKSLDGISKIKELGTSLPTIMEKLGHTLSEDQANRLAGSGEAASSLTRSSSNLRCSESKLTSSMMRIREENKRAESSSGGADEKREITAIKRTEANSAGAAAIVL